MIAVVQRVMWASVTVAGETIAAVGPGLVVLVAVERGDSAATTAWMAGRLAGLRLFPGNPYADSPERPFDLDVRQAGGQVLLVSNFTVAASCDRGRRPSLDAAAAPGDAEPLFNRLRDGLRAEGVAVETGRFGASMQVELVNDGPVTFLVRSRQSPPP